MHLRFTWAFHAREVRFERAVAAGFEPLFPETFSFHLEAHEPFELQLQLEDLWSEPRRLGEGINRRAAQTLVRRLVAAAPREVEVRGQHEEYVVLAVQGPDAPATVAGLGLPTGHDYMRFEVADHAGATVVVCRTGYTGERGYELIAPNAAAAGLWDALVDAGARP